MKPCPPAIGKLIESPGDDSDLMEGGEDVDTAEVNGGNGGEVFTIAANGARGSDGAVVTWEMENGSLVTPHVLPRVSTSFQVVGRKISTATAMPTSYGAVATASSCPGRWTTGTLCGTTTSAWSRPRGRSGQPASSISCEGTSGE